MHFISFIGICYCKIKFQYEKVYDKKYQVLKVSSVGNVGSYNYKNKLNDGINVINDFIFLAKENGFIGACKVQLAKYI